MSGGFDRQYCVFVLQVASFRTITQTAAHCMCIINDVFLIHSKILQRFRRTGSSHSLYEYCLVFSELRRVQDAFVLEQNPHLSFERQVGRTPEPFWTVWRNGKVVILNVFNQLFICIFPVTQSLYLNNLPYILAKCPGM